MRKGAVARLKTYFTSTTGLVDNCLWTVGQMKMPFTMMGKTLGRINWEEGRNN